MTELLHIYDGETGKYMRSQEPAIDPLETKLQGKTVYVTYPYSTTKELPEYTTHTVPYFIDDEWVVKGAWKNVEVYNTENKNFEYCYTEELGDNQVFIDDKDGIKKFKEEQNQWIVNDDYEIVENPQYDLLQQIAEVDNELNEVEQTYNDTLNNAIEYPVNGKQYKAKWVDDGTYAKIITGAQAGLVTFPIDIWDATELEENKVSMSEEEFGALCVYLASIQNTAFNTRKVARATLLVQKAELEAQKEE